MYRRFTLIELLVNAACKTGVLYNRCGMLSLWGGALKTDKNGQKRTKTDIGAPQNTAYLKQYNACKASASCTGGALHICRRQMLHTAKPCFIQSAFTLIELLVVIAIIAILAAMLMPALQKARDKARDSECKGRLKQLGSAMQMYVDSFNGYLMGPWIYESNKSRTWFIFMATRTNILPMPNDKYYDNFALYAKNYYCPAGPIPTKTNHSYGQASVSASRTYKTQDTEPGAYIKVVEVGTSSSDPVRSNFLHFASGNNKNMSGFPIYADSVYLDTTTQRATQMYYFHKGQGGKTFSVGARHNGNTNITFADGHVAGLHYNKLGEVPHKIHYYGFDDGRTGLQARTED